VAAVATEAPLCACHSEPMRWNRSWRCRVAHREEMRRRYYADPEAHHERTQRQKEARRQQVAAERERRGDACQDCGHEADLEWHHRDPSTKLFKIAAATWYGLGLIAEELAKCDLLCPNCHLERHAEVRA